MHRGRGYRGWMAATTVAVTLSLVFLAVEKYIRTPEGGLFSALAAYQPAIASESPGILLNVDPGLEGTAEYPRTDRAAIARSPIDKTDEVVASLLRRPPELADNVTLQAPIAAVEFAELPLHASQSGIDYLMETLDEAFERPLHVVSAHRPAQQAPSFPANLERLPQLPSPASISGRLPPPRALLDDLMELQQLLHPPTARGPGSSTYIQARPAIHASLAEATTILQWATQVEGLLSRIVVQHGLEHPASAREIEQLVFLAAQAPEIGNALTDHNLAARVLRVGYGLQRRAVVWDAIQDCLDGTTIALTRPRSQELAKEDLLRSIEQVESKLANTGDAEAWRSYLLLDELQAWAQSEDHIWSVGNELSLQVLSRLHWRRLGDSQRNFLAQPEFEELAAHLVAWGRDPIDYRQLLTELEQLEEDPISRVNTSLASAVQVLRLSDEDRQQLVADAINNHYRNANLRLSVTAELLQSLLPDGEYETRPVRQRILGADTRGSSSVHTQLQLKLIPDETGWNIDVGVLGDMYSNTRSSKGPAVFHNTSVAQITSHRYVRLDPRGYQVSSDPTNVASQDYLRKMSTDFDGLPIFGDFVRLLVREQFDQKRGLAQRITRRLIANEADVELDRRLEENLATAEQQLQQRLVGPLEQLNLNPMVVAMHTSEKRLTIRYRVANEMQMAANTPRPRAPTDSLMSLQLHQSAINNAISQLGLSGRTWTLPELFQRLREVFKQSDWELPDDVPRDITIRFANTRPATVEMAEGKLRLTLRIAELKQPGRLHIERFLVSSNYVPVAEGLSAELIRDGVVEIVSHRDRLALRLIFAKVFVSRPQIPLISETWRTDPRAEGLAVSQLDIRDGWLAVAISHADSAMAAEVASRARALKLQ